MAKKFGQFAYFDPMDAPTSDENIFDGISVYSINIYATPGSQFKIQLNDSDIENNLIYINGTGIFNMTFNDNPITSLTFEESTIKNISSSQYVIIDFVYEGELKKREVNINE